MNTGICRVVLVWYSPMEGYSAPSFGHRAARVASASSSACTVNVFPGAARVRRVDIH